MTGPNQPVNRIYPQNTSLSSKKTIRFQPSWYKRHPWLSYDEQLILENLAYLLNKIMADIGAFTKHVKDSGHDIP